MLLGSNTSSSLTGASRLLHAASSLGGHLQSLTRLLQIGTSRQIGSDRGTRHGQPVVTFSRRLLYKVNGGFYITKNYGSSTRSQRLQEVRERLSCALHGLYPSRFSWPARSSTVLWQMVPPRVFQWLSKFGAPRALRWLCMPKLPSECKVPVGDDRLRYPSNAESSAAVDVHEQ